MIRYPEYGFYEYDGKAYNDKLEVFDAALAKRDYDPSINFNFNDHVFSAIDWSIEPSISINELYRMRAQQLRDEHDYLVLMYTGGSDSREALYAFLNNGIFIDEVVTIHPKKLTEKMPIVQDSNHDSAFIFEYDLTTIPGLREIHKLSPKTKIEIVDMSDDLLKYYKDDNYFCDKSHVSQFGVHHTIKSNSGLQYLRKISEGRGRVGVIYGVDKPKLIMQDNKLFCYFTDTGRTGAQVQRATNAVNFTPKMFFSTPDIPLLQIKQCHMVKNAIEQSPKIYSLFNKFSKLSGGGQFKAQNIVKRIIYPNWDHRLFQATKFGYIFTWTEEKDFLNYVEPGMGEVLDARKRSFLNKYGKFNINLDNTWMINVISRYYCVGDIKIPSIR